MKYTKQSCNYIIKNFFYIFPLTILPAFLLSLSTDETALQCLVETVLRGDLTNLHFDHIFRAISVLNFGSLESVIFGLLSIVGIIVFVALLMAFLEKHMRIGKRTFNGLFSKLNDNFVSTVCVVFIFLALYEIWSLVLTMLLYIVTRWQMTVLAYICGGIVYVAMHVALIYLISTIYLWLPCMQITGFRLLEALNYSYQLVASIQWKILIGQLFFLFSTEAVMGLCVMFAPNSLIFTVVTTALFSVLIMIFCVRMEIVYFDRDHIERADIHRYR